MLLRDLRASCGLWWVGMVFFQESEWCDGMEEGLASRVLCLGDATHAPARAKSVTHALQGRGEERHAGGLACASFGPDVVS